MATYTIGTPDGRELDIEAADEATALRGAQEWAAANPKQSAPHVEGGLEDLVRGGSRPDPELAKALKDQRDGSKRTPMQEALNAASFGFMDEGIAGLKALGTGAANLVGKGPGYGMADAYKASLQADEEKAQAFRDKHGLTSGALGILGSLINPATRFGMKFVGGAPTVASRIGKGTALGAAIGGTAGLGNAEGDVVERLPEAAAGAALGGATGGILEGGIAGAGALGRALKGTAERGLQAMTGETAIPSAAQRELGAKEAREYVARVAQGARVTPEALEANALEAAGKPITAAEAMGRSGMTQLQMLGRRLGKTPDELETQLRLRHEAQPTRILDDIEGATALTPEAIGGDFVAHTRALRDRAAPLYDEAYAAGPINSETLQNLLKRPAMRDAMNRAVRIAQEEGRNPSDLGFIMQEAPLIVDGKPLMRGGVPLMMEQKVEVTTPSAQTWDFIKRGLDDVLETYRDKTTGKIKLDEQGRAVLGTLNSLREELVGLNPAYKRALEAGGEPIRLEEAFREAPKLMSGATSASVFRDRLEKMSSAQKEALKAGWVNDTFNRLSAGKQTLRDTQNPLFRAKMAVLFGDDTANRLMQGFDFETSLARGNRMMPGTGSDTMTLTQAAKDSDIDLSGFVGGLRKMAGGNFLGGLAQTVGAPVAASWRMSQTPADIATRDAVGDLLRDSPSALAQVLREEMAQPFKPRAVDILSTALPATIGGTVARPRGAVIIEGPNGTLYDAEGLVPPEAAERWRAAQ